ncbi:MAG: dihydroorotase [Halobacteriovoraceae bacterium]|nr:dihydroorotase [Halobacteriovoraceae bacterium]
MTFDMLIKNGQCVIDEKIEKCNLYIKDGRISKISSKTSEDAREVINAKGLYVLPGVIDSQVHFREPGLTHKEDIWHGSRAALLGGVTTFLEMPNTNPPTTSDQTIAQKVKIASEKSHANFGFFMGADGSNLEFLVNCRKLPGCCGVKIFLGSSTGSLLLYQKEKLQEIFSKVSAPIAIHSEDEELLRKRMDIHLQGKTAHDHLKWRNKDTALSSTIKVLDIARKEGKKLHILHISTKDEISYLASNKDICTVEVTPQHLSLHAPDCYDQLGTYSQMNPPIRDLSHQRGLWGGIDSGVVDVIGSDHAAHTKEEKDKGYPGTPSGMPGVQTLLPVMLDHVHKKRLSLTKLVRLICKNPAKLYGLKGKGELKEGADADITIVDLNKKHVIRNQDMASKCGWTPFDSWEVTGMPEMVVMAGVVVMKEGGIIGDPKGKPIEVFN